MLIQIVEAFSILDNSNIQGFIMGTACKCVGCEYYEGSPGNSNVGTVWCGKNGGKKAVNGISGCSSFEPDYRANCQRCVHNVLKNDQKWKTCAKGLTDNTSFREKTYCRGFSEKDYWDNDVSEKKGGCFISTIVCEGLGKEDDCYELTILRLFRDQILLKCPDWASLVKQYYIIAPDIADNYVEFLPKNIKSEIYLDYIMPCINSIEEQNYSNAVDIYSKLVNKLSRDMEK